MTRLRRTPSSRRLAKGAPLALLGVIGAATLALASPGAGVTEAQPVPPPGRSPVARAPTPRAGPPPPVQARTREEKTRLLHQDRAGSRLVDVAQETRGRPITIAGKTVQLPPDAYVDGVVTHVLCPAGVPVDDPRWARFTSCPETPFLDIRRGKSQISIAVESGRIIAEHVAPGEERAFDALKEGLRR